MLESPAYAAWRERKRRNDGAALLGVSRPRPHWQLYSFDLLVTGLSAQQQSWIPTQGPAAVMDSDVRAETR
jgi:hypothetical protein